MASHPKPGRIEGSTEQVFDRVVLLPLFADLCELGVARITGLTAGAGG